MLKAVLSNNEDIHGGNFGINVVINHIVSDLSIDDFVFTADSGNGITNLVFPDAIEVAHVTEPNQTLCMIPVEVPEGALGSFEVSMRDRQYTVDWANSEISDRSVDLPDTEEFDLECVPKVFRYN